MIILAGSAWLPLVASPFIFTGEDVIGIYLIIEGMHPSQYILELWPCLPLLI